MTTTSEDTLVDYPWERTLGARPLRDGRAEFRVWAPHADRLILRLGNGDDYTLDPAGSGIHEGVVSAEPGDDYTYLVSGRELPDPCSRWQPDGLRGPSRLFDARALPGVGDGFRIPALDQLIIYELHIGTFTEEGTFDGSRRASPGTRRAGESRRSR